MKIFDFILDLAKEFEPELKQYGLRKYKEEDIHARINLKQEFSDEFNLNFFFPDPNFKSK